MRRALTEALRGIQAARMPHAKLLAAEADFRTACVMLQLNERLIAGEGRNPLSPSPSSSSSSSSTSVIDDDALTTIYAELTNKWAKKRLPEIISFANDSMTIQLSEMFQHLHDIDSGDLPTSAVTSHPTLKPGDIHRSAAFTPSIGPSTHTNPLPTLRMQMKSVYEDAKTTSEIEIRKTLQARMGFALWLGPSQSQPSSSSEKEEEEEGVKEEGVKDSNSNSNSTTTTTTKKKNKSNKSSSSDFKAGLYLRGKAAPGTVVALYPGAVFNGEMLQKAIDCGHLGNPSVQRMFIPRYDEAILDVYASTAPKENAFALAQYARHPPPGGINPNVMRLQVDFLDPASTGDTTSGIMAFPTHLREYIPNTWGSDISAGQGLYSSLEQNVWMKGSVLIALRPLWDEEIFVDHTLNPYAKQAQQIPAWAEQAWIARKELRMLTGRASAEAWRNTKAAEIAQQKEIDEAATRIQGNVGPDEKPKPIA